MSSINHRPQAVILAGGRSSRFEGKTKAMKLLADKPLITHVLDRLRPQVARILLSVQEKTPDLEPYGADQVVDSVRRHRGPLAGLSSALRWLEQNGPGEWLLLVPCDAPFLPIDLASRLMAVAKTPDSRPGAVVARYQGIMQPTFSLWNTHQASALEELLSSHKRGGLMTALDHTEHKTCDWPAASPPPFFNVNSPAELDLAERLLIEQARAH